MNLEILFQLISLFLVVATGPIIIILLAVKK
uniref:Photosystem II protein psb30 n=1 Tax=Dichotomosiphon tuberosus TaxID=118263 RepID=A0A386AWR2_9CHLO|nr:photosystem II protein psb30 [Dichotomosiphon tuberosus]